MPHAIRCPWKGLRMSKNSTLLTLDRLRLAVSRVETARKRSAVSDESVDTAYQATILRDVVNLR